MAEITDALLNFSNHCNLNCTYCFVPKERKEKLSWSQVEDFLVWFVAQPAPFKRIGIAGGEPLLELAMIKKVLSFIRKVNAHDDRGIIMSEIFTNGTILNTEIIEFLKEEEVELGFSLDGNQACNINRRFKDGTDSFDIVWANIRKYKREINEQPPISLTISPENADKFYSSIRFFLDNGFYRIKFSPAVVSGKWTEEFVDVFIRGLKDTIRYYFFLKKTKKNIPLHFLEDLADQMNREGFFNCSLGRQVVLSSDGNVYGCPLAKSFNHEFLNLVHVGHTSKVIDLKKLGSLRECDCLNRCRFKGHYSSPYIRDIGRMACLLFESHGVLAGKDHVNAVTKLFLRIHKEINKVF